MYLQWDKEAEGIRKLSRKKSNYSKVGDELQMTWDAGAFVAEGAVATDDRNGECERDFLNLLEFCSKTDITVTTSERGNYAPKIFVDMGKSRKWVWTVTQYRDAMWRLLEDGRVIIDPKRKGRDTRLSVAKSD
jgi:hypothetical protein